MYELEKAVQDTVSKSTEPVNDSYYLAKIKRKTIFLKKSGVGGLLQYQLCLQSAAVMFLST